MFVDLLRQHLTLAERGLLSRERFPTWFDERNAARRRAALLAGCEAERDSGQRPLWGWVLWHERGVEIFTECWIAKMWEIGALSGDPSRDEARLEDDLRHVLLEGCVATGKSSESRVRAAIADVASEAIAAESARAFDWRRYCDEVRLTRRSSDGISLERAGEIALRLRGRDVLRWLLALEVALSCGTRDQWRISAELGRSFAAARSTWCDAHIDPDPPFDYPGFDRLRVFGLLQAGKDLDGSDERSVTELGRELFGEIDRPAGLALSSLAQAVLADELLAVAGGRAASAELTSLVRHTRMMAHELRNALVPVQFAVKEVRTGSCAEPEVIYEQIDRGIERALKFVTDAARSIGTGAAPTTSFAVGAVIRDAVESARAELACRVNLDVRAEVERVQLRGRRDQLVLALLNLVRNAAQVGGAGVRIYVSCEVADPSGDAQVLVYVEDDGPGVKPGDEGRIFADGVSLRSGGTGHGLAFVREVVEVEFRGAATCEQSARGGARFTLRLPIPRGGEP